MRTLVKSPGPTDLRVPAAVFLLALAAAPLCASDVIAVPADVFQVQAAIDQASPGDIVVVQPADYGGALVVDGKGITVVSRGGVARFETLTVRNVPSDETVVFRGLEGAPSSSISWTRRFMSSSSGSSSPSPASSVRPSMTGSGAASSWSASSAIAAAVCFLVLRRRCLLSSPRAPEARARRRRRFLCCCCSYVRELAGGWSSADYGVTAMVSVAQVSRQQTGGDA